MSVTRLPAHAAQELISADAFARMESNPDVRLELVAGKVQEMVPPNPEHGDLSLEVGGELRSYLKSHGNAGRAYVETGYRLKSDPDTVRIPDVSVMLNERLSKLESLRGYPDGAPDLAVEVLSPSDTFAETEHKALEYLETGASLVWIINPFERSVHVYSDGGKQVTRLSDGDLLTGGELLPGFSVRVAGLFPPPLPKPSKP